MNDYKTVLISGASSGIGAELARRFAKQGKVIGILALAGKELTSISEELIQLGAKAVYSYPTDVSDKTQVRDNITAFITATGRIDLWIACAGIDYDIPLQDLTSSQSAKIENLYHVNLMGLIYSTNAVLEQMLNQTNPHTKRYLPFAKKNKGYGHIVGIASLAGKHIFPKHADYSATKTAVDAYLESIRVRILAQNITVTTVSPGFIRTPMTANHTHPMPFILSSHEAVDKILAGIEKKQSYVNFPKPLLYGTYIVKALPKPVQNMIARITEVI